MNMTDTAAKFIETPEAQEILKILARQGMGIQLIHVHPSDELPEGIQFDNNNFAPLPHDYVVVEENCQISFRPRKEIPENSIATAWAWGGISAVCVSSCVPHQAHGHVKHHQRQNL